jgi:hypothetical protein
MKPLSVKLTLEFGRLETPPAKYSWSSRQLHRKKVDIELNRCYQDDAANSLLHQFKLVARPELG